MENLTRLENILCDIHRVNSLIRLLDEHFTCMRDNKDLALDYYSITRLFNEYGDLSSTLINYTRNIENGLKEIINVFYEELRKAKENEN